MCRYTDLCRGLSLKPQTTPVSHPQSNKSLVKTMKRDYVVHMPKPDTTRVLQNQDISFEHYNERTSTAQLYSTGCLGSFGAWSLP